MKRIYITAIPLDSNFAITPYAAEPVNYTQTTTQPTCYPITPILADTAHDGDEIKVIAVRQVNSPHSENLEVFRRELDSLGKPYTLVDLTTPENQQRDGLLTLFEALTDAMESDACYYADATFGTKTYPLVLSSALHYAEKILDDTEVCGIYYRELTRESGQVKNVEFVDIAGLVKGASQGAGLGNKFLGHIRECDAIVHVVRCFDDDNIIHVVEDVNKPESVDPIRDIDAIDLELILADLEVVSNRLGRQQKAAKTGNKAAAAEAAWLADLAAWLESGKPARSFDFDESDDAVKAARKELGLLSAKPVIYACNVGEDDLLGGLDENPYFPLVAARAKEENAQAIPICAKTEEDIAGSTQEEKIAFLQEMGIESTGLDKLIKASYELLGLISFLTDGKKECRAWTIRKGTKAPQAAGKIHSDFERGFIRAQVIAYKDLEDADFNYAAVKAKGLQRTEGKEYVVNDGDVIEFLFNV